VFISAPNLTLLRFINSWCNVVSLTKLPLEASVVVPFYGYSPDDPDWGIVENYKYSILRGLSNTTTIELNAPIREVCNFVHFFSSASRNYIYIPRNCNDDVPLSAFCILEGITEGRPNVQQLDHPCP
jgi:hypothetical protein